MNGVYQIALGTFLLSCFVTYAWWIRVRVWMLRQDLFQIRDRLWDEMRAAGMLDDPSHLWYRNSLNSLIRFAPALSWWVIWDIACHESDLTESPGATKFPLDIVPPPVSRAVAEVARCVLRYLFGWCLVGWVLWVMFTILGKLKAYQTRIAAAITAITRSEEVKTVGKRLAGV